MTLDPAELTRLLETSGALQRGHFELSSGLHSEAYVQCARLLEDPARARRLGRELAVRLRDHRPRSVVSPALGGLIIGHETAEALGVPFRFTERAGGVMTLRRGFAVEPGERVAVVEDVVTTGGSTRETAEAVERAGGEVVAVGAIIDRGEAEHPFAVPFTALLRLELRRYAAGECPFCAAGDALVKPGSRAVATAAAAQPSASR